MIVRSDFSSCVFPQNSSPVVPYLSMACVFAFILSFGLGPGNGLNVFQQSPLQLLSLINSLLLLRLLLEGGVTNILTTELFTQTTRPAAYMIAGSANWLSFFFISMVFPFIVVSDDFMT